MAKKKKEQAEEKVDQKDLMEEIKKMEAEKREKAMKSAQPKKKKDEKMSFDAWWMLRAAKIPRGHMKEVIRADFKGRKLSDKEMAEEYDKALAAYGLKL